MCYKQELAFPMNTFFNIQDNRIVVMDRNLIWSVLIIKMLPLLLQNVIQDLNTINRTKKNGSLLSTDAFYGY